MIYIILVSVELFNSSLIKQHGKGDKNKVSSPEILEGEELLWDWLKFWGTGIEIPEWKEKKKKNKERNGDKVCLCL